jgi:hypothetical protein
MTQAPTHAVERLERVERFLEERIAWLRYEADHGGDWQALGAMQKETAYILGAIRSGRYLDDGRPSWLVNAIPLRAALQSQGG